MRIPRLPLLLALATFAAALGLGAHAWRQHFSTEPVLRVRIGVAAGQPVPAEALEQIQVPAGSRPAGALAQPADAAGSWARTELIPGEYLLRGHLLAEAPPTRLAERIRPGMRIVSLPVRPEAALAGALLPGDLVDVVAAYPAAADGAPATTRTLASGLRVMDVRNAMGTPTRSEQAADLPGAGLPAAVLLEADPELATALVAAVEGEAAIYLLLAGRQAQS